MSGMRQKLFGLASVFLCAFLAFVSGSALAQSPVTINLLTTKTSYLVGEPVKLEIRVANDSGASVIAPLGFFERRFDFDLTFIGPDQKVIRFRNLGGGVEPGPPFYLQGKEAVEVEVILPLPDGQVSYIVDDARISYDLSQTGAYRAFVSAPLVTFSSFLVDPDTGKRYAFLDDPGYASFDPLQSNAVAFEIVPLQAPVTASLKVTAKKITTGPGSNPGTKKTPLENLPLRLFRKAAVAAQFQPVNHKTYALVWENIAPVASTTTDAQGAAVFTGIARDDYVVIGRNAGSPDFQFIGSPIGADDTGWQTGSLQKHLVVIEKADKTQVPAKTTRLTGSELLIFEPEFVLWDSSQELYPIVFESSGDWGVSTSVAPPEGFVADYSSLNATVSSSTQAVQFTVTDVGSRWENTQVTHRVTHKGKSTIVKTWIGVKLSKALAAQKNLGVWGHDKDPGTFVGGKKQPPKEK